MNISKKRKDGGGVMNRLMKWLMGMVLVAMGMGIPRAEATMLYRITYDNDGVAGGNANSTYTPTIYDIVDMHCPLIRWGTNPVPQIVTSTGPQGGLAIVSAAQTPANPVGYNSSWANAKSYGIHAVTGRGLTLEAIAKATSWTSGWPGGLVNQANTPYMGFDGGSANSPNIRFSCAAGELIYIATNSLANGTWHHYAGVWTRDAGGSQGKLEIFVDYASVTSKVVAVISSQWVDVGHWGFGTEGLNGDPIRTRSWFGTLDAAALSDEVLGTGSFVLQRSNADLMPDLYTENFESGWTNGATGYILNGAIPGRWAGRETGFGGWLISDVGSPQFKTLVFTNGAFNNHWWTLGGQYPFRLRQDKPVIIELSARIKQIASSGMGWTGWLYLMNRDQNGYGLKLQRSLQGGFHGADNHNYATITKFRGSATAIGENGTPAWTDTEGAEPTSSFVKIGTAYDGFINVHVRLTQNADGQPITVKLWHTESNLADTSLGSPDLTWVESGTTFGSILNLRDLNWVGVNAECEANPGNGPNAGVWFDDIRVESVQTTYGTSMAVQ